MNELPNETEWIIGSALALIIVWIIIRVLAMKNDKDYEHSHARNEQTAKCEPDYTQDDGIGTFMNSDF